MRGKCKLGSYMSLLSASACKSIEAMEYEGDGAAKSVSTTSSPPLPNLAMPAPDKLIIAVLDRYLKDV